MAGSRVALLAVLLLAVVVALHHSGRKALAKAVTLRVAAPSAVGSVVGLAVRAVS